MGVIDLGLTQEIINDIEEVLKHFGANAEDKRYVLQQMLNRMNKDLQTLRTQDMMQNFGLGKVMGMFKDKEK